MQGSYKILQNLFNLHFQQRKHHSQLALSSEKIGFALEIKKLKTMFSFCISLGLHYLCTHYQQINRNKIWKRILNEQP